MQELNKYDVKEGVELTGALLGRLTVFRRLTEAGPLFRLGELIGALARGETMAASYKYHELAAGLISSGARRVTGDLLLDYIIHSVLLEDSAFSEMAAEQRMDEAVYAAARLDLAMLGTLSTLTGETLRRWIAERIRDRGRSGAQDEIALMSNAAWGGAKKPKPQPAGVPLPPLPPAPGMDFEAQWLSFRYGDFRLRDAYAADEALEEVTRRMTESRDWRALTDDIWNLFASYGSGPYLKDRYFLFDGEALIPATMDPEAAPAVGALYPAQYERIMDNAIAFMRGDEWENMMIYGGDGAGKTRAVTSLMFELPEVRLVFVSAFDRLVFDRLIAPLARQPLKFIVLFDGLDTEGFGGSVLSGALQGRCMPGNVLLAATSPCAGLPAIFHTRVPFPDPSVDDVAELVARLIEDDGGSPAAADIRNACVDYQLELRGPLSLASALVIYKRLKN